MTRPGARLACEVCVETPAGTRAARLAGADRIEVCASLPVGGVTPPVETVAAAIEASEGELAVHVLVRPRPGDFVYSAAEIDAMLVSIEAVRALGVAGVVVGALTGQGAIDALVCGELVAASRPTSVTFHRAFDSVRQPFSALEQLIELGIDRLLTSGCETSALSGAALIGELVRRAEKRIVVMAGGGVTPENVVKVVRASNADELHFSGRLHRTGEAEDRRWAARVADIVAAARRAAGAG